MLMQFNYVANFRCMMMHDDMMQKKKNKQTQTNLGKPPDVTLSPWHRGTKVTPKDYTR